MNRITLEGLKPEEAYLLYEETDSEICVVKTFVDPQYRGKGLAKKLMEKFMEETKSSKKQLTATCSYAKSYLLKADDERIDKAKLQEVAESCRL